MSITNPLSSLKMSPITSTLAFIRDPLAFLMQLGQDSRIAHFRLGWFHAYLVNEPEYIREVLVEQANKFHKTQLSKSLLTQLMTDSFVIAEGTEHRQRRALVHPALHATAIAQYAEAMVASTVQVAAQWRDQQVLELSQEMMKITLAIVVKTLFGASIETETQRAAQAMESVVCHLKLGIPFPRWLPTPRNRALARANAELDTIILKIIREYRQKQHPEYNLLTMLMEATDEAGATRLNDQQVRDEVLALFIAGHETTANALTWLWYLLGEHPDVEQQVRDELQSVLGDRLPTLHDLSKLPYLEMVIKETLRLYPPGWLLERQAIEDTHVKEHRFQKNALVLISPYLTHRDSRWFEQPDAFIPERFTEAREKTIPKYAYLPFGGGARYCVGQAFASMEMKLIAATVLQKYHVQLREGQRIAPSGQAALRTQNGLYARINRR
jgi:cytochrome P450